MGGEDVATRFETLQLHAGESIAHAARERSVGSVTQHRRLTFPQATNPTLPPNLVPSQFMPQHPTSSMIQPTEPGSLASKSLATSTAVS
jgi:hypothetical protein